MHQKIQIPRLFPFSYANNHWQIMFSNFPDRICYTFRIMASSIEFIYKASQSFKLEATNFYLGMAQGRRTFARGRFVVSKEETEGGTMWME